MKELKIKIKDEEHYQQVQKCLITLGCVIPRANDMFNTVKFDFLFCYKGGSVIIGDESAAWANSSLDEKTLEELQEMVKEKNDLVDASWVEKEFKKGDRAFNTTHGWGTVFPCSRGALLWLKLDNGYSLYFEQSGKQDDKSSLHRIVFHSPQDASEYFANIKEPISREEELLNILYRVQEHRSKDLSDKQNHDLKRLIEYFENAVDKTAQNN